MTYKRFLGAATAALVIVIVVLIFAPGAWASSKFKTLYTFTGGSDGGDPRAGLVLDQAGNLYGTTEGEVYTNGNVFELIPNGDGSWTESVLSVVDSAAGLIFDQAGNLYGTSTDFGCCGSGGVFELIPNGDGTWTEVDLYDFNYRQFPMTPLASLIFDQAGNLYSTSQEGGGGRCIGANK